MEKAGFGYFKLVPENVLGFKTIESINTSQIKVDNIKRFVSSVDFLKLRVKIQDESGKWCRARLEKVRGTIYRVIWNEDRRWGFSRQKGYIDIDYQGTVTAVMQISLLVCDKEDNRHIYVFHYGLKTEFEAYKEALETLKQMKDGLKKEMWIEYFPNE